MALKPRLWSDNGQELKDVPVRGQRNPRFTQSTSNLHLRYGRMLKPNLTCSDPFYALSEVFSLTSAAEKQFLNMIAAKLDKDSTESLLQGEDAIYDDFKQSNLLHSRRILEQHIEEISATVDFIRRRQNSSDWPRSQSNKYQHTAHAVAHQILEDYEYLLSRAESLCRRCERAMTIAMNSANIVESKRGVQQAENVFKFTVLAAVYVPFSFTTSFFGMNFFQLEQRNLSVWIYFVTAIPIFAVSALIMFGDAGLSRRVWRTVSKRSKIRP
jgi:Mg2+ and Co2+ transporter CorA